MNRKMIDIDSDRMLIQMSAGHVAAQVDPLFYPLGLFNFAPAVPQVELPRWHKRSAMVKMGRQAKILLN